MTATSGHNNECSNKPQRYSTQDPRQHSNQQDRLGFVLDYGWSFTRFNGWKQKWWQLLEKKKRIVEILAANISNKDLLKFLNTLKEQLSYPLFLAHELAC